MATSNIKFLDAEEKAALQPSLRDPIEYRKSGLSLNHIVGCPLDCGYCVRHLFENYQMKIPHALMSDEAAVNMLVSHRYFQAGRTPIQLFNRATDPMLATVKPHTFSVLKMLDDMGLNNHVLIITRWKVAAEDCALFNSFRNIRLTIFVTYSGIDDLRIEPVDSGIAARSLELLYAHAERYRVILYWRPIVPGLNDSDEKLKEAVSLAKFAHATVFTGLFFRIEISEYYRANNLPIPYESTARRKILPKVSERRVLDAFEVFSPLAPKFRKTSCAVGYVHGLADYNGHYGIRELCDICPAEQIARCSKAWAKPDEKIVEVLAKKMGAKYSPEITSRAILVEGLDEAPRYYIQHSLGYQCHDRSRPHYVGRHGRADIGWDSEG
jgi:DNA repair photolyase